MGIYDQLNYPLSTLMPQTNPYGISDYASLFESNNQIQLNNLRYGIGLQTLNSSNSTLAMNGRNMVNDSLVNKKNTQFYNPNLSTSTSNSNGSVDYWNQGFNTLSNVGLQLGGQAGNVLTNASKFGSGIKAGLEGAGKSKAGGIGAAIGAASDMVGSFMPLKTEYSGTKGDLTQTLDSTYDAISDAAMSFGPIGCVCAGSRIINNKGKFLNIEDLTKEEGIIGWGNKKVNKEQIFALKEPQYKECLRITLQSGWFLECSTDHPILYAHKGRAERININGKRIRIKQWEFKRADELQIDDNVGIANEIPIWGNIDMWNPYLIGMLIGDGTYGKDHGVHLFSADPDTWKYLEDNNLGIRINFNDTEYTKEFRAYRIINGPKYLRELGIYEQTKLNKRLPTNIHLYTKESICLLIAGLIDTDGCVQCNHNMKEYKIIFYLKNKALIDLIREQLLKLGIHCSVQKTNKREGLARNRIIHSNEGYKLIIKDKLSLITFYNNIKLNISYKLNTLEDIYNKCIKGSTKDNRLLSGAKADKVIKIEPIGLRLVYNLQADDDHTYIANGIITHNTLVGGIMKGGALLGKGMNALGGGTDGMCVCAGTKVFTTSGKVVNIEDLLKEDGIIGWKEDNKQIVPQTIHDFIEPRQKECLELVLKNGYILRCSIDHPILSDNNPKAKSQYINGKRIALRPWKFRRADELKVGDFVGLANNIDYWGTNDEELAYLIGLLIGDGSYSKDSSCRLISADPDTWTYIESNNLGVLNHCDDSKPEKYSKEIRTYRIIGGMDLLHKLGIAYLIGKNKTLPKNIDSFTKDSVCKLLAGLFDTDGNILVNKEKQQYSITLYLSNKSLLEEIRILLHKLGIFSTIGTRKAAKYKLEGNVINPNESYRLEIHDIASVIAFYKLIPLNISYKKDNLALIYEMLKDKKPQEHNDISGAKQVKIISITAIGFLTVYNLQADNDHTYIANGIITHNTTTDAILGSSFLNLTPIGLINGFGGSKTLTFTKDDEAFAQVGSSYTGSDYTTGQAAMKAGKKYGLFSLKAKLSADNQISEAKRQLSIILDISQDVQDRTNIRTSMSAINGNRRALQMQGGYDLSAIRFGKYGMSIFLDRAKLIIKALNGTKIPYKEWVKTVNPNFLSKYYDLETAYKYLPILQLNNWKTAVNSKHPDYYMNYRDKNGNYPYHLLSVARIPGTDDYIFLKKGKEKDNPELHWETDTYYNGTNGLKNTHDLIYEGDRYYYRKKKTLGVKKHKNGGSVINLVQESVIELVSPNDIPEFKNGGSVNVIPEGALHARKHNLELDGITEKGIPVIDNSGKQQAEIEKEEIILRLEVTLKLEKFEKKYYSEETSLKEKDELALEAGKLLVKETLHNTKDNAGLL